MPSLSLAVVAAVISLSVIGAIVMAGDGLHLPLLPMLVPFAAFLAAVVLANWRTGVYLLLAWLVIEDLPRKFLGNDLRLFFAKDILAVFLYVAFLVSRLHGAESHPRMRFLAPLLAFVALGMVQVFNPRSPSLIYGFLGLRMYFFYVPLFFIGYALVRSERDLRHFLAFNLVVATVIAGLGIVQGVVGLDFLNPADLAPELQLARLVRQAPISGALVPRPSSVFVSDSRFAWHMLTMFLLGLATLGYSLARRTSILTALVAVGMTFAAIVLSGVRGTFMFALVSIAVFLKAFRHYVGRGLRKKVSRWLLIGLAAGGLALATVIGLAPEAVSARWSFYYETIALSSPASELAWRVWGYPIGELLKAFTFPGWLLGYGIGTSSLGVQYVPKFLGLAAPDTGVESGYGTLILELGVFGLMLWLLWTVTLLREGWHAVRQIRDTWFFPIGFAMLWFAFLLLFPFTVTGIGPYQNYLFNAYLWLFLGILIRLPELASRWSSSSGLDRSITA